MREDWYRERGIDIVDVDRGGKITYHGPGQLVGYPIMAVDDVVGYVATLERAVVDALAEEGLQARGRSHEGRDVTGAWIDDRKIASIGIHIQKGVTTHGFAVNVDADLEPFEWVVACGLGDVRMTSIARERGGDADLGCFRKRMAHRFAQAAGRRQRLVTRGRLERSVAPAALHF
jgi:lipoyl(octanoyl) transferase